MAEDRKVDQPFSVDRLPPIVHRAICELKNVHNLTWVEIEDLSAEPFGQKWDDQLEEDEEGNVSVKTPSFKVHPGRGFVQWDKVGLRVLELFPDMRIPKSNLQRWYKTRVVNVRQQMLEASENSRIIAESFAKATVEGSDDAVMNAARDQLMVVLSEDGSAKGRMAVTKALISLAEVMQGQRANDIKERKAATDERKIALLEQREKLAIAKLEAETERLAKKIQAGQPVTQEDLVEARKRTFGF